MNIVLFHSTQSLINKFPQEKQFILELEKDFAFNYRENNYTVSISNQFSLLVVLFTIIFVSLFSNLYEVLWGQITLVLIFLVWLTFLLLNILMKKRIITYKNALKLLKFYLILLIIFSVIGFLEILVILFLIKYDIYYLFLLLIDIILIFYSIYQYLYIKNQRDYIVKISEDIILFQWNNYEIPLIHDALQDVYSNFIDNIE